MTDNLAFLIESAGCPARSDIIAYHLKISVSALEKESTCKAVFDLQNKMIQYHPALSTSEIRMLIGLGIVLNDNFISTEKIIIENENISLPNFKFNQAMKQVGEMLITQENVSLFVHKLKIYKIEELAQKFDVSEEMMYYRLQELKMIN